MNKNVGKVFQILGPVVDVDFSDTKLPNILNALEIETKDFKLVLEVASEIGDGIVNSSSSGSNSSSSSNKGSSSSK